MTQVLGETRDLVVSTLPTDFFQRHTHVTATAKDIIPIFACCSLLNRRCIQKACSFAVVVTVETTLLAFGPLLMAKKCFLRAHN